MSENENDTLAGAEGGASSSSSLAANKPTNKRPRGGSDEDGGEEADRQAKREQLKSTEAKREDEDGAELPESSIAHISQCLLTNRRHRLATPFHIFSDSTTNNAAFAASVRDVLDRAAFEAYPGVDPAKHW